MYIRRSVINVYNDGDRFGDETRGEANENDVEIGLRRGARNEFRKEKTAPRTFYITHVYDIFVTRARALRYL